MQATTIDLEAGPAVFTQTGHTRAQLAAESCAYEGRGGTSAEAAPLGLEPAFLDRDSGTVYRACYANGLPAPAHLFDGLPESLVLRRDPSGRVQAVKQSVIAGFSCAGRFYTRDEAVHLVNSIAQAGAL